MSDTIGRHTQLWELYLQHRAELFSYALSLTRSPELSEDAVHSAFVSAAGANGNIRNHRAYLFRTLRNECFRLAKSERSHSGTPESAGFLIPETAEPSQATIERTDRDRVLLALLDQLAPNQREVLTLRFYARLKFREIARVLEQPLPTVASHYRRALKQLAKRLKELDHDF